MKDWIDYITETLEMTLEDFNKLDYRTRNSFWEDYMEESLNR